MKLLCAFLSLTGLRAASGQNSHHDTQAWWHTWVCALFLHPHWGGTLCFLSLPIQQNDAEQSETDANVDYLSLPSLPFMDCTFVSSLLAQNMICVTACLVNAESLNFWLNTCSTYLLSAIVYSTISIDITSSCEVSHKESDWVIVLNCSRQ